VAVVTHGGPSTVMDARVAGRLPIVVARHPDLGEHIDSHQVRFSRHLARHCLARVVDELGPLEIELERALADPDRYQVPVEPGAVPGLVAFGMVADRLLATSTDVTGGHHRAELREHQGV
jgi:hypothetical protein